MDRILSAAIGRGLSQALRKAFQRSGAVKGVGSLLADIWQTGQPFRHQPLALGHQLLKEAFKRAAID